MWSRPWTWGCDFVISVACRSGETALRGGFIRERPIDEVAAAAVLPARESGEFSFRKRESRP